MLAERRDPLLSILEDCPLLRHRSRPRWRMSRMRGCAEGRLTNLLTSRDAGENADRSGAKDSARLLRTRMTAGRRVCFFCDRLRTFVGRRFRFLLGSLWEHLGQFLGRCVAHRRDGRGAGHGVPPFLLPTHGVQLVKHFGRLESRNIHCSFCMSVGGSSGSTESQRRRNSASTAGR